MKKIPLYLIINKYYSKDIAKDIEKSNIKEKDSNIIEKFFGYFSIFIFFSQIFYKGNSGSLLFIMNPCHMLGVIFKLDKIKISVSTSLCFNWQKFYHK